MSRSSPKHGDCRLLPRASIISYCPRKYRDVVFLLKVHLMVAEVSSELTTVRWLAAVASNHVLTRPVPGAYHW